VLCPARYIPRHDVQAVFDAADVVAAPYPFFDGLSSIVLLAVEAGKPVIVNDYGWCRAMVGRLGIGWACAVLDVPAFTGALETAPASAGDLSQDERARRFQRSRTTRRSSSPGSGSRRARPQCRARAASG